MLAQVDQETESFGADGAYERRKVYQKVQDHSPDGQMSIPPQKKLASVNMAIAMRHHIRVIRRRKKIEAYEKTTIRHRCVM